VRMQDELPMLKERLPHADRVFRQKAGQLKWEEPESIELAASVWSRLKRGATLVDLQRDLPRSTYAIYRTVSTLLENGQIE